MQRNVFMATHTPTIGGLVGKGGVLMDETRVWENEFTRQLNTGESSFPIREMNVTAFAVRQYYPLYSIAIVKRMLIDIKPYIFKIQLYK